MTNKCDMKVSLDANTRTQLRKLTTAIKDLTRALNDSSNPPPTTPSGGLRLAEPESNARTVMTLTEAEYEEDLTVYCDCC